MSGIPWSCNTTDCDGKSAQELTDELSSVLLPVTVFVGVEGIIGLIFNILVLYVYSFRYRACNFRYFVMFLAVVDLSACLTTIPGEIVTHVFYYVYPVAMICKIKTFFNVFTCVLPGLLLLCMTVDRFLKVIRPLGWQIQPKAALIMCIVMVATAFVVALPVAFYWGTRTNVNQYSGRNITVTICEKDQRYEHTQQPYTYAVCLITLVCINMFAIVVLYIVIARKMCSIRAPTVAPKGSPSNSSSSSGHVSSSNVTDQQSDTIDRQSDISASEKSSHEPDVGEVANFQKPSIELEKLPKKHFKFARRASIQYRQLEKRIRRKILIVLLLTAVFIVTSIVYIALGAGTAKPGDILDSMTPTQKAVYFFFFRLYFINHVINPLIYAFLDSDCRSVIRSLLGRVRPGSDR